MAMAVVIQLLCCIGPLMLAGLFALGIGLYATVTGRGGRWVNENGQSLGMGSPAGRRPHRSDRRGVYRLSGVEYGAGSSSGSCGGSASAVGGGRGLSALDQDLPGLGDVPLHLRYQGVQMREFLLVPQSRHEVQSQHLPIQVPPEVQ